MRYNIFVVEKVIIGIFGGKMSKENIRVGEMSVEEYLRTKEAIQLPQNERLMLLMNAKYYILSGKRTSADVQIREMLDFFEFFLSYMLAETAPREGKDKEFILLSVMASAIPDDCQEEIILQDLAEALNSLRNFEAID